MFNKSQEKDGKNLLANEIEIKGIERQLDMHQGEVLPGAAGEALTGGTIAFFSKAKENSEWAPLIKDGSPYVMTIVAAPNGVRTFDIPNGSLFAIKGVPAGLTATGTEWVLNIISGRKG